MKLRAILNLMVLGQCTVNGRFKQSKCYELLIGPVSIFPIYKQVWCSLALPRHRIVFWLGTQKKLQTKDRLIRRMQGLTDCCLVCDKAVESHSHLFYECSYSQIILNKVNCWLGGPQTHSSFDQWIKMAAGL